jgi:hypothetical protein
MRLLLDEHMDPLIAEQLRQRRHDVVAVAADDELRGSTDESLIEWAAAQHRAVVTYDIRGFSRLLEQRASLGLETVGVVFVSRRAYPADKARGPLVRDLSRLREAYSSPDALAERAVWLGDEAHGGA